MMFMKKSRGTKRIQRSAIISIITLFTFLFTMNSAFALQAVVDPDKKISDLDSKKNYCIIVKLNNETASQAEASMSQNSMEIQKSSSKSMADILNKYKIKKMEPVYKGLVQWKKKTGKTEQDFIKKVQKDFTGRSERSRTAQKTADISNTYVIETDAKNQEEYEKLLESFKKDARFEYAEPDLVVTTQTMPNDPYFLSKGAWGQYYEDLYGLKITSSSSVWDIAKGNGVTVAVVDTGVDHTHPDIAANIWTNTKEIPGNGVDDDGNGYIDDTWGWDYVNNDNSPTDDHGHGSHVAGTIAAVGNNRVGVVGVAPEARIMPVKGLNAAGNGYASQLAEAIIYAAQNGADIINNSWAGKGYSQVTQDAVNFAYELGVVVIAAAGNDNGNADTYTPAGLEHVLTVAATDYLDRKASFSNWGSSVEVAAPGVDILSLRAAGTSMGKAVGDSYTCASGTSMAAPHAAGVAALILSRYPEFTNDQVSATLQTNVTDVMSPGRDDATGYGRINAAAALQMNGAMVASIDSPSSESSVTGQVAVTGSAKGSSFSGYTLEYGKINGSGMEPVEWKVLAQGNTPVDQGRLGSFDTTVLPDGKYVLRLSVKDSNSPQTVYFDYVEVVLDIIKISSPAEAIDPSYAAQIKPGKVIPIQGTALGQAFQRYRMEWAEGLNPTEWYTTGFTLENGGNAPVTGNLLANWDSGVYPGRAGYYQLRLLVDGAGYTNEARTMIYLEPDLTTVNWPQKLEKPLTGYSSVLPVYNSTGQADLVGIVNAIASGTASIKKYAVDGSLQYNSSLDSSAFGQAAVGDIDEYPGEETVYVNNEKMRILRNDNSYREFSLDSQYDFRFDPVVLADLDGDSVLEILVLGRDVSSMTRFLYAYKADGTLVSSQFPVPISDSMIYENNRYVHFIAMDMNNDGEKEIIARQSDSSGGSFLKLYKWDGTPLAWQAAQPSFSNAYIKNMMGGDLDHDGQGEIILWAGGYGDHDKQRVYVIASDGSIKPGWPYTYPDYGTDRYDFAIADMDRDGTDDIIYTQTNEIGILKLDGKPLSSAWPHIRSRYSEKFSLGDINNDGFPEILFIYIDDKQYTPYDGSASKRYTDYELRAMDRNAQTVQTWKIAGPEGTKAVPLNRDPVLGDFDNNGKVDIAICLNIRDENNYDAGGALTVLTTGGDYRAENMDWPVRFHDPQNSSVHIATTPIPAVTGVSLNKSFTSITAGEKEQLIASVEPAGASKSIVWSVYSESVPNVAVVAQDGTVTANSLGTAVIRAASATNPTKYAECTVTVTSAVVPVTGVSLNKTSTSITVGQTEQLTATVVPANASNKNILWTVQSQSGSNVATVSSTGLVTANNAGTAVIRATSEADPSKVAECTVTVTLAIIPVTGVSLNKTSTSITVGQTEQLTATVVPANASNKNILWTVQSQSGSNVAAVSSTGLVTANNAGTAVIRATSAADPSKYAECTVTVTASAPVAGILFSEGFEGCGGSVPAGWAVQDTAGTAGEWSFVSSGTLPDPGGPKAGAWMAKFNSCTVVAGNNTRLYRTSGIKLGNDGTYTLEFWMYHDADNVKADNIQVQVSTDGGSTWINVGTAVNRYKSIPGWEKHTVSLDAFKGAADLRIAFLASSQFGRNMYLDEITVTGTSSAP